MDEHQIEENAFATMPGVLIEPLSIDFTVYYALQLPTVKSQELPSVLLALHGWGQSCKRFIRDFYALREKNIIVVAPQAPNQFYLDVATRKVGFNWLTLFDRQQAISDVNKYLNRLLDVVQHHANYDPRRVVLMGFSQGSSMAYRFGISGLIKPAGLVSCCSDLPMDVAEALPGKQPFPVLLAQGTEDKLVLREQIVAAKEGLNRGGFPYEEIRFKGGHEITPALVNRIGEWVEERGRLAPRQPC